jgi:hypothetical protein
MPTSFFASLLRKPLLAFLLTLALAASATAQNRREEESSSENERPYRVQTVYGLNLNSNAGLLGGGMIRHSRAIGERMYHSFSLEVVNIKHPREQRTQSVITGESYVPGKANYLMIVRPQYGRELVLFRRSPEQGVQINFIGAVGPSLGIVTPYLIDYDLQNRNVLSGVQYNPAIHTDFTRIQRAGRFGQGLGQSRLQFGACVKAALSFEFGSFKNNITGLETGVQADFLTQPVIMMPLAENRSTYISFFVNLFYGSRR